MKKLFVGLLCVLLSVSLAFDVLAQRRSGSDIVNLWAENLNIDGDLSDWDTVLTHVHERQGLEYELRNDTEFIYLAVRITDLDRQTQALGQGIRMMINTDGRRRDGQAVVFPIADRIAFRGLMSREQEDENRPTDFRTAALQSVRGIYVQRFDRLLDGMISQNNDYGVAAAAGIDSLEALCVEVRIPISLLAHPEELTDKEMAYNIRLNGFARERTDRGVAPVRSRPYYPGYGYPYGRTGQMDTGSRSEPGVWNKFMLATAPLLD